MSRLLFSAVLSLWGGVSLAQGVKPAQFPTTEHPRVFATEAERSVLLAKIHDVPWAQRMYEDLTGRVEPIVARHRDDPEYAVSRLQMNWEEGKRYTRCWAEGNAIPRREGDAPFPTVRIAAGRVGTAGTPSYDRIDPYGNGDLVMRKGETWQRLPMMETGLGAETVNEGILNDAYRAAIVYYFTGDRDYAKFAADIVWTVIRGASYQEQLNPDSETFNHYGFLSHETLGDTRRYATVALTWDFLYNYLVDEYFVAPEFRSGQPGQRWAPPQPGGKEWALERAGTMFQKYLDNKLTRGGGLEGNWNLNEQQSAILYALALDDDEVYANGHGREYYVNRLLYGPSSQGHGALVDVAKANLDPQTGLWPEAPGGYGQNSIAQLVQFGYWYVHAGLNVLGADPLLRKAALSFPQIAFPNGYATNWGDSSFSTMNQATAEYMIAYARTVGDAAVEDECTALLNLAGGRRFDGPYYSPLFFYVPELKPTSGAVHYPRVSYSAVHSLIVERNLADSPTNALAYSVYGFGEKSGHRHRNGLAMELYGRDEVLGVDPGAGPNYWDRQHSRYNNQVGAHNTVVPGGQAADRPMDMVVYHAEPLPVPGADPSRQLSPLCQFSDTGVDFNGKADQRRVMGIVRTSAQGGYYVDIFRSRMRDRAETTHDYLYHNMGTSLALGSPDGELLALTGPALAADSGPGYEYFATTGSLATDADLRADFGFGRDGIQMHAWLLGETGRTVYSLTGPATIRYYLGDLRQQPVPTLLVRQTGEAWQRPFVVVYEPSGKGLDPTIRQVGRLVASPGDLVAVSVEHGDGSREVILNATDPTTLYEVEGIRFQGIYAVVMMAADGSLRHLYLGAGIRLECAGWSISAKELAGGTVLATPTGFQTQTDSLAVIGDGQ